MAEKKSIIEKMKDELEKVESSMEKVEQEVVQTVEEGIHKAEEVGKEILEDVEEAVGIKKKPATKKKEDKKEAQEEDKEEKKEVKPKQVEDGVIEKKSETILTPIEDYIKTASYLGTKVITPSMRKYVYRRRLDGLAILNTLLVDKKLAEGIKFITQYKPDEWTLICKREAGWRAAKMFSELTGVRLFTKKYPSGVLTNTMLDNFIETKMIMICDPWLDKNALKDAKNIRIPVASICDTNNHTSDIDVVMIANNKSNKSLGLMFWLLAREYCKAHNIDKQIPSLEDFVGEELVLEEPKKKRKAKEKEEKTKKDEDAIEERMRKIAENADAQAQSEKEGQTIQVSEEVEQGV